jgi:hypothetical protein
VLLRSIFIQNYLFNFDLVEDDPLDQQNLVPVADFAVFVLTREEKSLLLGLFRVHGIYYNFKLEEPDLGGL